MTLVRGWLDTFRFPYGEPPVIDTDSLDSSMLPHLDWLEEHCFSVACREAGLSVEEAREVLRRVRSGLTCEAAFPDAACEFLDADLVFIAD